MLFRQKLHVIKTVTEIIPFYRWNYCQEVKDLARSYSARDRAAGVLTPVFVLCPFQHSRTFSSAHNMLLIVIPKSRFAKKMDLGKYYHLNNHLNIQNEVKCKIPFTRSLSTCPYPLTHSLAKLSQPPDFLKWGSFLSQLNWDTVDTLCKFKMSNIMIWHMYRLQSNDRIRVS